ncbi:hypothetical protein [Treponema primitia]|uniref:hypothetical protein n=1 Tax=Treponema primitia TaxID=88058 RepID=UPI0002555161|nr:hypothetical protein [Treponema primitia]
MPVEKSVGKRAVKEEKQVVSVKPASPLQTVRGKKRGSTYRKVEPTLFPGGFRASWVGEQTIIIEFADAGEYDDDKIIVGAFALEAGVAKELAENIESLVKKIEEKKETLHRKSKVK